MKRLTEKREGQNVIPLRQDGKQKWTLCNAGKDDVHSQFLYGDHADKLAEYEDLENERKLMKFPCAVGDTVYYWNEGIEIEPMRVEEITITEYAIILTLIYSGNDDELQNLKIKTDSTAFENKVIFLTPEEAKAAVRV